MDCQCTSAERNNFREDMHDKLPVEICAQVFNQDDNSTYENIISGLMPFSHINNSVGDEFALIATLYIVHVWRKVTGQIVIGDY